MRRHLLIIITFATYLIACAGGSDDKDDQVNRLASTTSLRIGRSSNTIGPVATSASLASGESLMIIYDATSGLISEVLFKDSNNAVVRVPTDPSGRPNLAQSTDIDVSFSNYTETTVDVTFSRVFRNLLGTFTYPLENESLELLTSEFILGIVLNSAPNDQSAQRGYLSAAVIALRIVGCSGVSGNDQFNTSDDFANLMQSICNSPLLDEISRVALNPDVDLDQITVTRLPEPNICSFIDSFFDGRDCILNYSGRLISAAIQGIVGVFPTPTPRPTAHSTTNPTQVPTQAPTQPPAQVQPNPAIGNWQGFITQGSTPTTLCQNGPLNFTISSAGDVSCANPHCNVTGDVFDVFNQVPLDSGQYDDRNNIVFTWYNASFDITGMASGTIAGTTSSGTFSTDAGCFGTFTAMKR